MNLETMIPDMASGVGWKLEGNFVLAEPLRRQAQTILEQTPFPTTRTEAWKYTRVAKIRSGQFEVKPVTLNVNHHVIDEKAVSLVFVNGHFAPQLSSEAYPDGM